MKIKPQFKKRFKEINKYAINLINYLFRAVEIKPKDIEETKKDTGGILT
jgi:hypothetical protein